MLYINNLTDDASQQFTLTGIPNLSIDCTLQYYPRTQRWIMGFSTTDNGGNLFTLNGLAVVTSLNLLRQFKNFISFGISCVRPDGLDPYQITDFQTQIANLYLLDSTDVATIEADWFTGIQ